MLNYEENVDLTKMADFLEIQHGGKGIKCYQH